MSSAFVHVFPEHCTGVDSKTAYKTTGFLPPEGGVQKKKRPDHSPSGESFPEEVTFGLKS